MKIENSKNETTFRVNNDYNASNIPDYGELNFSTIKDAVNKASAGYLIEVCNGTYYENVVIDKELMLMGVDEDEWGNDTDGSIIDGGGDDNVVEINTNEVNLSGFTIKNSRRDSDYAGVRIVGSDYVDIFNNTIYNDGNGIRCTGSNNIDIVYNSVYNNDLDGMHFEGCDTINILHNKIYDCGEMGIYFLGECYNIDIINNTIDNINWSGIELQLRCNNINIINNNINNSGNSGISFDDTSGNNNLISANNISNCGVEGIEIVGVSVEITYNQIYKNGIQHGNGPGIFIGGRSIKDLDIRRNHILEKII